jgi:hypothetical protein
MALGPGHTEGCHDAGKYVDEILYGANPADLPIKGATQLSFSVSRSPLAKLGLEPPSEISAGANDCSIDWRPSVNTRYLLAAFLNFRMLGRSVGLANRGRVESAEMSKEKHHSKPRNRVGTILARMMAAAWMK